MKKQQCKKTRRSIYLLTLCLLFILCKVWMIYPLIGENQVNRIIQFLYPEDEIQSNNYLAHLDLGSLEGVNDHIFPRVISFLGVPFAEPPDRWSPPEMKKNWDGVLKADRYSAVCPQFNVNLHMSEDCLYLNIYTPTLDNNMKLPVMVWFFGGGFNMGSAAEHKLYDGSFIVQNKDVVIVTVSYRVGVLGFLTTNELSGNYGFLDQQLALKWVNKHIHHFGGDPNHVTIWGQSAGAFSVNLHLSTPSSFPYFHKAIILSSPIALGLRSRDLAVKQGNSFSESVGCKGANTDCLRKVPLRKLLMSSPQEPLKDRFKHIKDVFTWFPNLDGSILTCDPLNCSNTKDVPIIIGTLKDEAELFRWYLSLMARAVDIGLHAGNAVPVINYLKKYSWIINAKPSYQSGFSNAIAVMAVRFIFGNQANAVLSHLNIPNEDPFSSISNFMTKLIFTCPSRMILRNHYKRNKSPAYQYVGLFQPQFLRDLGGSCGFNSTCHATDLPLVFHTFPQFVTFTNEEQFLSDQIITYFTHFASMKQGISIYPRITKGIIQGGHIEWKPFQKDEKTFIFDQNCSMKSFELKTCDFIDKIGYDW